MNVPMKTEPSSGIWFEISSDELRTHLTNRIEARLAKVSVYKAEIERLRAMRPLENEARLPDGGMASTYMPVDPTKNAEARMRDHGTAARRLKFWRDHLPKEAVFRIAPHEADAFELLEE